MSKLIEINLRPDERTLRQFGFIALAGFALLALLAWQEWLLFRFGLGGARVPLALAFAALAGLALGCSLVYPKANRPLYVGLTLLALPIGLVVSSVIMAMLFYLVIAPIGFLLRGIGRDPLERRFVREADTYWVDARPARKNESYFRQF